MSDTPETDEIGLLLDTLEELIGESIPISKPIGLTLCDASRTIAGQRDRITELWSALELVRRERDEASKEIKELKQAAREVLRFVPYRHCPEMHHRKRDMHLLIDKLVALVKEEAK